MPTSRPPAWRVALAFVFANGCVFFYAMGLPPYQWAAWLLLFLAMEITRQPGATFSECCYRWCGIRPRRRSRWVRVLFLVVFGSTLVAHLATGGQWAGAHAIVFTGTPLGAVIALSMLRREP
jgi:hypothetical protein